jgi:hyaluronate lyase
MSPAGFAIALGMFFWLASPARADAFDSLRTKWRDYLVAGEGAPIGLGFRDSPGELEIKARRAWSTMNTGASRTSLSGTVPFDPALSSTMVTSTFTELETMALAWATPGCSLHGDEGLADAVTGGMDWMTAHVYTPTAREYGNWWDWEIGGPQAFNNAIALMYPRLTPAELAGYCAAIDGHSPGGPANMWGWQWSTGTVDLGFVMVIRGILGRDDERMHTALANVARIFPDVKTGNGFYEDGSFVLHTNKAYTGAYGVIMLNAVADLFNLLEGSPWQFSGADKACVITWVSKSFEPVFYNGAMMDMVRGRTVTRANQTEMTDGARALAAIRQIARFAPPQAAAALLRFADAPRLAEGQFQFAGMDRVVALRKGFGFGVSMCSARIANYESLNGENLHGWFTGEGMAYLYLGDADTQFTRDFWPTVDPYHLPGTTIEILPRGNSEGAGKTTSQHWVGGAQVLGRYGSAGMSLADPLSPSLKARKSWFMFDDEIVCLGAGITSSGPAEIHTTVEDRRLGDAPASNFTVDGDPFAPVMGWSKRLGRVSWCALDGVGGYYFPGGAEGLQAAFVRSSGRWSDVTGHTGDASLPVLTDDYLKLWFNHGAHPSDASYSYVVLPNRTAEAVASYASGPDVVVIANTASVQAAKKPSLGIVAANFWADGPGTADLIATSAPSSIITCASGRSFCVGISDPTQAGTGSLTVTLGRAAEALVSADPGVTVVQLSPTIILRVEIAGSLGRSFEAAFDVNPASGLVRDVHVSRANPPWRRLFEVGRDVRVDLD